MDAAAEGRAALHAVVHGDVQGVGFRYFVQRRAEAAGVAGWVRNRPDGTVECLAEGTREALERLVADLERGPGMAEVESVEVDWRPAGGESRRFEVRS
jgi:acylphosphatase